MLRVLVVALLLVAWVCGEAAAYYKAWEDGDMPERASPYEQAMLKRLQTYLDSEEGREAEPPAKRQMRYNQCYFNPISCFKRRK